MIDHDALKREQLARIRQLRDDPERAKSYDPNDLRVERADTQPQSGEAPPVEGSAVYVYRRESR